MQAVKALFFLTAVFFSSQNIIAQSDSAIVARHAMSYADSMLKSFRYNDLDKYTSLSYPGVIKYYGGKKNYQEYVQRARSLNTSQSDEAEHIRIIQMLNDISEWQCVIEKTRETMIDGKKAMVISYMVGQSKDDGQQWKFFDVAFNSVENVIYIMPDIFSTVAIPQRQVVYEKNSLAGNR